MSEEQWKVEDQFEEELEAIAYALRAAQADEGASVFICRGPGRCVIDEDQGPCPFCYEVMPDDDRSIEEILRAALQGN